MSQTNPPGALVFVLSGPAGAGKTAVVKRLRTAEPDVCFCVTATTRAPRPGERHGVDYFFYSEAEFSRLRDRAEFLEYARIPPPDGPFYGTPIAQVRGALGRGQDVFVQVDVQGKESVRSRIPQAITMFLRPPDPQTLRERLVRRGTEPGPEMEARLQNAHAELSREAEFDYSVVNADGRLEQAVAEVRTIMREERDRPEPRYAALNPGHVR